MNIFHRVTKQKGLLVVVVGFLFLSALAYFKTLSIPTETFQQLIVSLGWRGPIIYILLNMLTYVLAPLGGTPLFFAGFYVFGKWVVFYTFLSSLMSSVINFYIARIWGRSRVSKLVGEKNMRKIDELAENYGLQTLLFLRVFQAYISDFVSYAFGFTEIRFLPYFVASTLGMIPGTLLWYWLLLRVKNVRQFTLLFISLVGSFLIVPPLFIFLYRRYFKKSSVDINEVKRSL